MQTLIISKLIEFCQTKHKAPKYFLIFCDESIIKNLLIESLSKASVDKPAVFSGKSAIADFVSAASMGSLFAPHPPSLIEIDAKITEKQWNTEYKNIEKLPKPCEFLTYFLAPVASRNTIKNNAFFDDVIISWSPNEIEAQKALITLAKRYPSLADNETNLLKIISQTAEYYASDLLACDEHFERMHTTKMSFEDALLAQNEVKSFHVLDAFANGNPALIELRMQQCLLSGEDITLIFKTISSFLRQLSEVHSRLNQNSNIDNVLRELEIRQPLQQIRIKKAVRNISISQIATFFFCAAELEMTLRLQKNAHAWLAQELIGLLANK